MATSYMGRNASIKVGTELVSMMTDWNIESTADIIREDVFGDIWARKHGIGALDWRGTANGLLDLTNVSGQKIFEDAAISGTKLTTVRFYIDGSTYYISDTASDADAGMYVTGFSPSQAQGNVARVAITFEGTGPLKRTT